MKIILLILLFAFTALSQVSSSRNFISTKNGTTTALGNGETYAGTWEDGSGFSEIRVAVKTDQVGDLYIDQSPDGINNDSTLNYVLKANTNEVHRLVLTRKFYRIRITNDSGSSQTYLRAQVRVDQGSGILSAPRNLSLAADSDAISTRPSSNNDEIVTGRRADARHFTKFGYRTGLTAAGGEETVWATAGNFTPLTTASTFTIAYNNTTDGSGTTGALTLFFDYVDSNGMYQQTTHTLETDGSDVTSFSGLGINRVAVSSSGSAQTNTNAITITATTGGTTQAIIPALGGVTQMSIFHMDANSFGILKEMYIQTNKTTGGQSPRVQVKMYVFNRNIQTRFELFRSTIDTSSTTNLVLMKPIGIRLTPTDVVYWVADTNLDSTDISIRYSLLEYKID